MTVGICATVHLTQHQSTNNKFGLMLGEGRGGVGCSCPHTDIDP